MGKALVLDAVVPASSQLPKWADRFPSIPDPRKVQFSDTLKRSPPVQITAAFPGWAELRSGYITSLDTLGAVSSQTYSYAGTNTGTADVDISCTIDRSVTIASTYDVGLFVRSDGDFLNTVRIVVPESMIQIQVANGGSPSVVASAPLTLGTTENARLRVTVTGNDYAVFVNGVQYLSYTNSVFNNQTHHGIIAYEASGHRPISNVVIAAP